MLNRYWHCSSYSICNPKASILEVITRFQPEITHRNGKAGHFFGDLICIYPFSDYRKVCTLRLNGQGLEIRLSLRLGNELSKGNSKNSLSGFKEQYINARVGVIIQS